MRGRAECLIPACEMMEAQWRENAPRSRAEAPPREYNSSARSACPKAGRDHRVENIPVVSWIVLRGALRNEDAIARATAVELRAEGSRSSCRALRLARRSSRPRVRMGAARAHLHRPGHAAFSPRTSAAALLGLLPRAGVFTDMHPRCGAAGGYWSCGRVLGVSPHRKNKGGDSENSAPAALGADRLGGCRWCRDFAGLGVGSARSRCGSHRKASITHPVARIPPWPGWPRYLGADRVVAGLGHFPA